MCELISIELVGVLEAYKRYEIEYDRFNKIIYINKAIPPIDYYYLRYRLRNVPEEIKDIRVYGERLDRIQGRNL